MGEQTMHPLVYALHSRGMTMDDFARQLKVIPGTISRWKLRQSVPRPSLVKRAAGVLGITTEQFMELIAPQEPASAAK